MGGSVCHRNGTLRFPVGGQSVARGIQQPPAGANAQQLKAQKKAAEQQAAAGAQAGGAAPAAGAEGAAAAPNGAGSLDIEAMLNYPGYDLPDFQYFVTKPGQQSMAAQQAAMAGAGAGLNPAAASEGIGAGAGGEAGSGAGSGQTAGGSGKKKGGKKKDAAAGTSGSLAKGKITVKGAKASSEQKKVTETVIQTALEEAQKKGLSSADAQKAAQVAVMTINVESGAEHLGGGDRDSQGAFQQRPSAGWGSYKSGTAGIIEDTKDFLGVGKSSAPGLFDKIKGNKISGDLGKLAQSVQASAFPSRYSEVQKEAERTVATYLKGAGKS
jgi:hypothetical protein